MHQEILDYYNDLANHYDENRFSNSYGKYIHAQEIQILERYLQDTEIERNLDLACGTGRFLNYAHSGIDLSPNMISVATEKFPKKSLTVSNAEQLPFEPNSFENIFSLHLFMHLEMDQIERIIGEACRVLVTGGKLIFDIPSKKRRNLTNYKADSWHGASAMSYKIVCQIAQKHWEIVAYHGVAFLPIHRFPKKIRRQFITVDNFMCNWLFKDLSSHLIFVLRKK